MSREADVLWHEQWREFDSPTFRVLKIRYKIKAIAVVAIIRQDLLKWDSNRINYKDELYLDDLFSGWGITGKEAIEIIETAIQVGVLNADSQTGYVRDKYVDNSAALIRKNKERHKRDYDKKKNKPNENETNARLSDLEMEMGEVKEHIGYKEEE